MPARAGTRRAASRAGPTSRSVPRGRAQAAALAAAAGLRRCGLHHQPAEPGARRPPSCWASPIRRRMPRLAEMALGQLRGPHAAGAASSSPATAMRELEEAGPRLPAARTARARAMVAARLAACLQELARTGRRPCRRHAQGRAARLAGAGPGLGHAGQAAGALRARAGVDPRPGAGRQAAVRGRGVAGRAAVTVPWRCLFWVQSLLGSGHLRRALLAGRGFRRPWRGGDARERRPTRALGAGTGSAVGAVAADLRQEWRFRRSGGRFGQPRHVRRCASSGNRCSLASWPCSRR